MLTMMVALVIKHKVIVMVVEAVTILVVDMNQILVQVLVNVKYQAHKVLVVMEKVIVGTVVYQNVVEMMEVVMIGVLVVLLDVKMVFLELVEIAMQMFVNVV
jgi:hypothetical protein